MTPNLTIVDHPLVQHKLTLLRRKDTSTRSFRELTAEIGALLVYELMRDAPVSPCTVETPLGTAHGVELEGKKIVLVSVLRAGAGMLDGMLTVLPSARVGHIGLYRDRRLLTAVEYFCKLPAGMKTGTRSSSARCWPPAARQPRRSAACSRRARARSASCAWWRRPRV